MAGMRQDYRENLRLAFDTVREHKLRSFLAVLGVMIGVMLVILVVGLVQGFRMTIQDEIASQGIDTAWVSRFDQDMSDRRRPLEERIRPKLTLENGLAGQEDSPAVKQTAVSASQWEQTHNARYEKNEVEGVEFRGTFPAYLEVYANATMKAGRFFSEAENEHQIGRASCRE